MNRTAEIGKQMIPKVYFAAVYAKPAGRGEVDPIITEMSTGANPALSG